MTLHRLAHDAIKMAKDNSPLILTAFGVAGTVTTALFTGKAAIKAQDILRYEESVRKSWAGTRWDDRNVPITPREKIELTWKEFIPPVVSGVATIACIVCSNRIGTRRAAAMAAAYSLSERAMTEYRDKVVEKLGEVKERKVREEILQDRIETDPVSNQEIFATGKGNDLCYEKLTGRYFFSSMENIKHAVNRVNHKINRSFEASLNDFYDYVGLDNSIIGDELGWNTEKLMEVTFASAMADGNRPCLAFDYHVAPIRNYFRYN